MPEPTALLVSRDPSLTPIIRRVSDAVSRLHLETCPGADQARARLRRGGVVLLLAHLHAESAEGQVISLLREVALERHPCPTVVLSACPGEDRVAALLRAGAADCLPMPADPIRLARLIGALTLRARLDARPEPVPEDAPFFDALPPGLSELAEQVRRVAPQDVMLLLTGETGTGKTGLARLVHQLSDRRDHPFLVVDCCALSPTLVESELFGHVKGAFTGADRDRPGKLAAVGQGTLLLDEVNSLPPSLQGKLLRAVDERVFEPVGSDRSQPVRARLIAASNVPLEAEVAAGRFRADLYYRLNVVGFHLPALRDRPTAVAPLAVKFLAEFACRNRPDVRGIDGEALRALENYNWPGNIRELRNVMERVVALSPGPEVQLRDLPEAIRAGGDWPPRPAVGPSRAMQPITAPVTLLQAKDEAEVRRILGALQKHGNNRLRAAAELGISRMGLYKKLHKYGLIESANPANGSRTGLPTLLPSQ